MKMLAKEPAVFVPVAVLWCFPLKWKEFSQTLKSKHFSQIICRHRKVVLVEIFIRSANYLFYVIFAMTCDVHRNKKCSIFHLFLKI